MNSGPVRLLILSNLLFIFTYRILPRGALPYGNSGWYRGTEYGIYVT